MWLAKGYSGSKEERQVLAHILGGDGKLTKMLEGINTRERTGCTEMD